MISERGSWLVVAWAREVAKSPKAKKKVMAAEVVVGEKGKVTGMVAGQQVVIRGTVSGVICAKTVALLPRLSSRNLPYPKIIDPEAPPLRPERRVPNSIPTLRRQLIIKLVANLSRCPCCATKTQVRSRRNM